VTPRARILNPRDDAAQWAADLWRRADLGEHALVVHAGSGSPAKNWLGMEEIARRWRETRGRVVVLTGPAERDQAAIAGDVVLRDESLSHVAAVLRRAERYAGNDSGISHLAGLIGARGTVVFGPSHPATWRPNGTTLEVIAGRSGCAACGADVFCTHRLAVEEVWRALVQN
jgi:ADP-heptose:LPS heptosyltransferase